MLQDLKNSQLRKLNKIHTSSLHLDHSMDIMETEESKLTKALNNAVNKKISILPKIQTPNSEFNTITNLGNKNKIERKKASRSIDY